MNGSAAFFLAVLGIAFLTSSAFAEQIVELDLDGVLGNGPDTIEVAVGAEVDVEVWLLGGIALFSFDLTICNPGPTLIYQGMEYHAPAGWTVYPPEFPQVGCVRIVGVDFATIPFAQPAHAATITYLAVVEGVLAEIEVDTVSSWVTDFYLQPVPIDSTVIARIRIGPTAADRPTWGSVKQMFR